MPEEILALIDKPHLLVAILAIGGGLGMAVERFVETSRRAERKAYWLSRKSKAARGPGLQGRGRVPVANELRSGPLSASEQLEIVMGASFQAQPVLNRSELRLLNLVEACLAQAAPQWRVMAQVSLGEIVKSEARDAYLAVNSKRVDLLLIDGASRPLYAVEFQGSGHFLGADAAARDAVKREALRKAGIGYVEFSSGDTAGDVRATIVKLVRQSQVPPQS